MSYGFGRELMKAKQRDLDAAVERGHRSRALPRRSAIRSLMSWAAGIVPRRRLPQPEPSRRSAPAARRTPSAGVHALGSGRSRLLIRK